MTTKLLSLSLYLATLYLCLINNLYPNDALFLIASSNLLFNVTLALLGFQAVYLSFINRFKYRLSHRCVVFIAILLGLFGTAGFIYSSATNHFGPILPLDYLILIGLSTIYGICSLSHSHEPFKFKWPTFGWSLVRRLTVRVTAHIPRQRRPQTI
jgi:uncharacterized membrane protein